LLKANWPTVEERSIFVRPTDESCENRFAYDREGTIQPKDPGDAAAKTTIQALNLCHEDLKRYRNEAWQETTDEFSSLAALRHRLSGLDEPSNGRLEPLCFVKKHALQRKLEKLRQFR
jgi:hypothetical protein